MLGCLNLNSKGTQIDEFQTKYETWKYFVFMTRMGKLVVRTIQKVKILTQHASQVEISLKRQQVKF